MTAPRKTKAQLEAGLQRANNALKHETDAAARQRGRIAALEEILADRTEQINARHREDLAAVEKADADRKQAEIDSKVASINSGLLPVVELKKYVKGTYTNEQEVTFVVTIPTDGAEPVRDALLRSLTANPISFLDRIDALYGFDPVSKTRLTTLSVVSDPSKLLNTEVY